MNNILSTKDIRKTDRADYWREAISRSFVELDCKNINRNADFYGDISAKKLGRGKLTLVTSASQKVERRASLISHSNAEVFLLSLQLKGTGVICQNGRQAKLGVGDFALYDTTRQYDLIFDGPFSQLVTQIPRELARQYLGVPEKLTALKLDHTSACGRLTGNMIQSLYQETGDLNPAQQDIMMRSLLELLGASYRSDDLDIARQSSTTRHTRLMMIKNFIWDNLTDYELTPKNIADHFNISTRYLHKLFAEEGLSPLQWLYSQRLEKCRQDMENPLYRGLTISEIAFKWGYNDMSHFSRTFKARYDFSPRAYRKQLIVRSETSSRSR